MALAGASKRTAHFDPRQWPGCNHCKCVWGQQLAPRPRHPGGAAMWPGPAAGMGAAMHACSMLLFPTAGWPHLNEGIQRRQVGARLALAGLKGRPPQPLVPGAPHQGMQRGRVSRREQASRPAAAVGGQRPELFLQRQRQLLRGRCRARVGRKGGVGVVSKSRTSMGRNMDRGSLPR